MTADDPFVRPEDPESTDSPDTLPGDLIAELDQALEGLTDGRALEGPEPPLPVSPDGLSEDPGVREMQETYLAIARGYLRPVGRYIKAIAVGEHPRELLEITDLVISPLIPKTEAVGLKEHAEDLVLFRSLIMFALGEKDDTAFEAMRKVVSRGFVKLRERFAVGSYRGSRLALRNVLTFYRAMAAEEKIGAEEIRRFFAVGVPSITWLRRTPAVELASLSGIPLDTARLIQKQAFGYRFGGAGEARQAGHDGLAPQPAGDAPFLEEGLDSEVLIDTGEGGHEIFPLRSGS